MCSAQHHAVHEDIDVRHCGDRKRMAELVLAEEKKNYEEHLRIILTNSKEMSMQAEQEISDLRTRCLEAEKSVKQVQREAKEDAKQIQRKAEESLKQVQREAEEYAKQVQREAEEYMKQLQIEAEQFKVISRELKGGKGELSSKEIPDRTGSFQVGMLITACKLLLVIGRIVLRYREIHLFCKE